jgi:hypothetical protein
VSPARGLARLLTDLGRDEATGHRRAPHARYAARIPGAHEYRPPLRAHAVEEAVVAVQDSRRRTA